MGHLPAGRLGRARRLRANRRQRGMSLIDTALALGVFGVALGGMMQMTNTASSQLRAHGAAGRLMQVAAAAEEYVRANQANLMAAIPDGGTLYVPVGRPTAIAPIPGGPAGLPSIQGAGFLPNDFIDKNSYGQQTAVLLRRNAAADGSGDSLEVLVTTFGGEAAKDADLGAIVAKAGAPGGMMLASLPAWVSPGTIEGAYGGWSSPAASWSAGAASPAVGHAMYNLNTRKNGAAADYLNRYNVGQPEANMMHTDIDANGNNINKIGNLDTKTIGNSRGTGIEVNSDVVVRGGTVTAENGYYTKNNNSYVIRGSGAGAGLMWEGHRTAAAPTANVTLTYDPASDAVRTNQNTGFATAGTVSAGGVASGRFWDSASYNPGAGPGGADYNYFVWPSGTSYVNVLRASGIQVAALQADSVQATTSIYSAGTIGSAGAASFGDTSARNLALRAGGVASWAEGGYLRSTTGGAMELGGPSGAAGLRVAGWLRADGALDVTGAATLRAGATVQGQPLRVTGADASNVSVYATGGIQSGGPLAVTGKATISGAATAAGFNAVSGGVVSTARDGISLSACGAATGDGSQYGSLGRDAATGAPLWCDGTRWRRVTLSN